MILERGKLAALKNSTVDFIVVVIGPSFELIKGRPGMHPGTPRCENRGLQGLMPAIPVKWQGIRIEPPTSPPIPIYKL